MQILRSKSIEVAFKLLLHIIFFQLSWYKRKLLVEVECWITLLQFKNIEIQDIGWPYLVEWVRGRNGMNGGIHGIF